MPIKTRLPARHAPTQSAVTERCICGELIEDRRFHVKHVPQGQASPCAHCGQHRDAGVHLQQGGRGGHKYKPMEATGDVRHRLSAPTPLGEPERVSIQMTMLPRVDPHIRARIERMFGWVFEEDIPESDSYVVRVPVGAFPPDVDVGLSIQLEGIPYTIEIGVEWP